VQARFPTLDRAAQMAHAYARKNWRRLLRLRERLFLSEEAFHLLMAGVVGIVGGITNYLFYIATEWVKHFTLHRPGDLAEVAVMLDWWQRMLIPTLGGLGAGLVLYWGLRLVGPAGSGNLIEAVAAGDGRLRFRQGLIKAASSILSVATGASIGREGAVTNASATLVSQGGQIARWQPFRLRLLVACGASAGMAAAYGAPISGAVFAAQIVLGNFSMKLFAPLIVSAVIASVVSHSFFLVPPWFKVPPVEFRNLTQLPWFLLLGFFAGCLGAMFLRMLRDAELLFSHMKLPVHWRLAVAGLIVGVIAVNYPEVWGNGYNTTNRFLQGSVAIEFAFGLLFAKLIATLVTVGAGTIGGAFTPTLFLGAALGATFGAALHAFGFATNPEVPIGAFALVGMGGVLAATVHSPLLAMIVVFEISLNQSLMPPLMLSCAVAAIVSKKLHADSVYMQPLKLKGIDVDSKTNLLGAASHQSVGDLMRAPVPPVLENTPLPEIAQRFLTTPYNFIPVVDANGRLTGLVSLHDLKQHLGAGAELNSVIALDVMRPARGVLTPNQLLPDALPVLLKSEQLNIPVVNNHNELKLVGSLVRAEALGTLSEAIDASTGPKAR
jgi:CIC family chloride channel protein